MRCVKGCVDLSGAVAGATVRISGSNLGGVTQVRFAGGRAKPKAVKAGSVDAVVPAAAKTGRVTVVDAYGQSAISPSKLAITPLEGVPAPKATGASSQVATSATAGTVFYYGRKQARLTYLLRTPAPQNVRIDLVRLRDERSLRHWTVSNVAPGEAQTLIWNGLVSGHVPPAGRYEFRIAVGAVSSTAGAGTSAPATAARAGSFSFQPWMFPVRGRHDFGGSGDRFGAGRAGHTHQGQDILAACGTPLVAARGGKVKFRGSQSLAGNYLVIDSAGSGIDTVYMHLRAPALVRKGQRVLTGQHIGDVGETGDATACHLHFEMWSAPGWYSGGSAFDPLPSLEAWDRVS